MRVIVEFVELDLDSADRVSSISNVGTFSSLDIKQPKSILDFRSDFLRARARARVSDLE